MVEHDPFSMIRRAGTSAGNYDLGTDDIIARLRQWQSKCSIQVSSAARDSITIVFDTLPTDLDVFARELCEFCPDLIDQGAASLPDMINEFTEMGQEIPANMKTLIDGIDFEDENFPLEIVKRTLQRDKQIKLWWD